MRRLVLLVAGVGLAAYLLTGVTLVRPGEKAVVRRFGRVVDTPGPGLYIGLPWGMDRVDRVPVNLVRLVKVGHDRDAVETDLAAPAGQLLTGDHNLVNIQVELKYAVREDQLEEYVLQAGEVEGLVVRTAEAVLAEWVAGRTVDEVLLQGRARLPAWLETQTRQRLEPYRLGVDVTAATVAYVLPPDEVRADFDAVTREQTRIRTRVNGAQQDAEARIREAGAARYRIAQETAAHVHQQVQLAQTEAAAFTARLNQYRSLRQSNPDFLAGLWWEEMGKLFARLSASGRIDVLDNHLTSDGLDITQVAPMKK